MGGFTAPLASPLLPRLPPNFGSLAVAFPYVSLFRIRSKGCASGQDKPRSCPAALPRLACSSHSIAQNKLIDFLKFVRASFSVKADRRCAAKAYRVDRSPEGNHLRAKRAGSPERIGHSKVTCGGAASPYFW